MIQRYSWPGGSETMLRYGPDQGPVVLAALPPFEEANRTRAFMTSILHKLSELQVSSVLPDLPGAGESLVPTEDVRLVDWRAAFAACADALRAEGRSVHAVAIRGGALVDLDADVASRWHFAPVSGALLVREMTRAALIAAREAGETFDPDAIAPPGPPVELAGNHISREMLGSLAEADPYASGKCRVVRLADDQRPADLHVEGAPPWRRAEPGNNGALAAVLARDIADWIARCGG